MSILASLGAVDSLAKNVTPAKIAIENLDFVDTSGEVKDEAVRHDTQLREFEAVLQETISRNQKLDPVAMSCGEERCSLAAPGVDQLMRKARAANARYLLAGGLHKMSTLIGWAKFIVFDLEKSGQVATSF